jgi:hypothetical protein
MYKTTPEASLLKMLNIKGLFSIEDILQFFIKEEDKNRK